MATTKRTLKIITNDNHHYDEDLSLLMPAKFFANRANEKEVNLEISKAIFDKVLEHLKNVNVSKSPLLIPEPLPDGKSLQAIINNDAFYNFINNQDFENTFELINAGALLELESLHDLACAKIADFMKGKTPEEVNNHFTIECQLTNDEAKELGLDVDEN